MVPDLRWERPFTLVQAVRDTTGAGDTLPLHRFWLAAQMVFGKGKYNAMAQWHKINK